MSRDITVGRTTIYLDKGRHGWALPGQRITKVRKARWYLDGLIKEVMEK